MPDIKQEITFLKGGVNTDDDPKYLGEGDVLFAENNITGEMGNNGLRVNLKGDTQVTFNPDPIPVYGSVPVYSPGLDGIVYASAVQPDGKVIFVGGFTHYNGVLYNRIIRFNTDGSVDPTFNVGTGFNGLVRTILIDGYIYLGGDFTSFNGTPCNHTISIDLDGSINSSFIYGTGFNGSIFNITKQVDGKLLYCGQFSNYNGTQFGQYYTGDIIRLNKDGSYDTSFTVGHGFNLEAFCIVENPIDLRIHVGGFMTKYQDTWDCISYARLNHDASMYENRQFSANAVVFSMACQSDGKLICGGAFTTFNGHGCTNIVRLSPPDGNINSDFDVDATFVTGTGFNSTVNGVFIQNDGKIWCCGTFTQYNGTPCNHVVRLNTDGSIDTSFVFGTGFDNVVRAVSVQSDNKVIFGGSYTTYQEVSVSDICRTSSAGVLDYETSISGTKDNKLKIVGSVNDYKRNSVILHLYSYIGAHAIISLNTITQEITYILYNEPVLNYQPGKEYRVDSRIVGDYLIFTDNYNPVRQIDIVKATNYTKYTKSTGKDTYSDAVSYTLYSDPVVFCGHIYSALKTTIGIPPSGTKEDTINWSYKGDTYYLVDDAVLDFVNRPFEYPLESLGYKSNANYLYNNLRRQQFQFGVRCIYSNNGASVLSPISKIPLPTNEQYANGQFLYDTTINNEILLYSYYSTLPECRKLELYVRNGNSGEWALYDTIDKRGFYYNFDFTVTGISNDVASEMTVTGVPESVTKRLFIGQFISGASQPWPQFITAITDTTVTFKYGFQGVQTVTAQASFLYSFRNDIIGQTADQTELSKIEDAVPQLSRAVETADNTIILAGNTEGYDNAEPKLTLHPYMITDTLYESATATFSSTRQYGTISTTGDDTYLIVNSLPLIVGALYTLTITIHWGGKGGDEAWTRQHIILHTCKSGEVVKDILSDFSNRLALIPWYDNTGAPQYDVNGNVEPLFTLDPSGSHTPHLTDTELKMWQGNSWGDGTEDVFAPTNIVCKLTSTHKSLKENSKYPVGVLYSDVSGRNSYVMLPDINKIDTSPNSFAVKYNSQSYISPRFHKLNNRYIGFNYEISSAPPDWAHTYQIVMGGRHTAKSFYQGYLKIPFIGTYAENSTWDAYKNSITDAYQDANGNYRFKINRAISETNRVEGDNTIIPEYEFQEGDRIRFIWVGYYPNGSITKKTAVDDTVSYEILGQEYPNLDLQYKKDGATSASYILDANGNKVSDPSTAEIILGQLPTIMGGNGYRTSSSASSIFFYEIYSAPKSVENELYYEVGEKYYCGDGVHHRTQRKGEERGD